MATKCFGDYLIPGQDMVRVNLYVIEQVQALGLHCLGFYLFCVLTSPIRSHACEDITTAILP